MRDLDKITRYDKYKNISLINNQKMYPIVHISQNVYCVLYLDIHIIYRITTSDLLFTQNNYG